MLSFLVINILFPNAYIHLEKYVVLLKKGIVCLKKDVSHQNGYNIHFLTVFFKGITMKEDQ
jgi:hypothetical protein